MKRNIFVYILLVAAMSFSLVADSKKIIKGKLIDRDGNSIVGASLIIPEKDITIKSDHTGAFSISFEGTGKIHVEVFKQGFLPYATPFINAGDSMEFKLDTIVLEKSILEEIVVTGTATPKLYKETPVKTFVASSDIIEKQGAISLADSLEIVTGVRVENNCQNCNFTQVRINGLEGKYSQILINGNPMISSLAGVYSLEQIPANMIEKLEVVKGGGSALYGGNAIAGVVNLILREPETSGSRLSLSQGLVGGDKPDTVMNFNTNYVSDSKATKVSFFANYQKRKPFDYNDDGFSEVGKLSNTTFGANFSHFFEDIGGKLKLNFASISEDRRGGDMRSINGVDMIDQPEHLAAIAESIKTRRVDVGIGWEQVLTEASVLKFNGSFSRTSRKSFYGAKENLDDERAPDAYGSTKNPVFYGSLQYHNFSIKNHSIITGISYKADKLQDTTPLYGRTTDATYKDFGFYAQDEIMMFDRKMTLLLGVRGDKHSELSDVVISPRASVSLNFIENLTVRATYSTGFRAPQVFDEDLHITQVGGDAQLIENSKDLNEEKSHSFTFGLDYGYQVANKLYQFSIGGFYTKINDAFDIRWVRDTDVAKVFERYNTSGAKVYGIETEIGFKISHLFEFSTGWTFQKSRYEEPEGDFSSKRIFRTPDVYGFVRADVMIGNIVDLYAEYNYTGKMRVPHYAGYIAEDTLEESDPFGVVNVTATKKFRLTDKASIAVVFSVKNLFDEYQKDLDKGLSRDAGYVYGPRFPRTFTLGLKYNF